MIKILQKEERTLHKISQEVPIKDIKNPKIKKILKEMSTALQSQNDGVAIAAPQIGYNFRIFVVAGKIFHKDFIRGNNTPEQEKIIEENAPKNLIFINPKISKLSRDKEWLPEGCLSVRWLYGKTFRSKKATITAYDENGKKFTRGASGLLAQIFQHETDHLNGILFTEHAVDIKEELPK